MESIKKGHAMKRILTVLLGIMLFLNIMCFGTGVFADVSSKMLSYLTISIELENITTQAELMNDTVVKGKVFITDSSDMTEKTEVVVAALSCGEVLQYDVVHTGMLPAGVSEYSFQLENIKNADEIKACVLLKDKKKRCSSVATADLEPAQVVVFKFDDLKPTMGNQVSKFDRAMGFLGKEGIPATAGILGKWLENAKRNPEKYQNQISIVKNWILAGHQLWIHGYDHTPGEFAAMKEKPAATYQQQKELIQITYDLMETVLSYRTTCFSASFNQNNESTISVLNQEFPQIQTVMFMHDTNQRLDALNLSSDSICEIETTTGVVSSELFFARYPYVAQLPYLVIQAHPGLWNEESFKELKKIVNFLKTKNCVFMTPEQYYKFTVKN